MSVYSLEASTMAREQSLPLQERVPQENTIQRLSDFTVLLLLLSLLGYRVTSLHNHGRAWLVALLCESWFTFVWILTMNCKWNMISYKTYPQRLLKRFDDLPALDMFVTTADPKLEPAIITANTVLSLLAVEYPVDKLACYVSDDGCSPITFYSLVETTKFAKLWVPFCKKYNARIRDPSVYFSAELKTTEKSSPAFMEERRKIKIEYEELCRKIENAGEHIARHEIDEFADFSKIERGNHEPIVKVVWDHKNDSEDGIPHLIYVAREKRPKQHHFFKAGAMNVLTRVSGVMTNAPFMLNVDCDNYANNPEVVLHAMCLLLGFDNEVFSAFVQTPQQLDGGLKDDPFGNQIVVPMKKIGAGIGGIQGPFYYGTGSFHRRKVIYGLPPPVPGSNKHDDRSYKELEKIYGSSTELIKSVKQIISGGGRETPVDLINRVDAAKQVAACAYELNNCWGKEVGWVYGSVLEDVLTSLRIHSAGWKSVKMIIDPPAFIGNAPTGGGAALTQQKRWATGCLEILFAPYSPARPAVTKKLWFRQRLAYFYVVVRSVRSIPEACYALLPAYSLLASTSFLPKVSEPSFAILLLLFIFYYTYTLAEYLECGLSARAWWNNQRMLIIYSTNSCLLGTFSVILKLLGLSDTVFEITRKDQEASGDDAGEVDPRRFTFDSSSVFVPGTAITIVNLMALVVGAARLLRPGGSVAVAVIGEFICGGLVMMIFWPFATGLVSRRSYGIPRAVIWKASLLVCLFLQLCHVDF